MSDLLVKASAECGVPLPETCKALDWQEETLFAWAKNQSRLDLALRHDLIQWCIPIEFNAPQFHEIWEKLPKQVKISDVTYNLDLITWEKDSKVYSRLQYSTYESSATLRLPIVEIQNNNLAEAAAQLYLKLKTDGKL